KRTQNDPKRRRCAPASLRFHFPISSFKFFLFFSPHRQNQIPISRLTTTLKSLPSFRTEQATFFLRREKSLFRFALFPSTLNCKVVSFLHCSPLRGVKQKRSVPLRDGSRKTYPRVLQSSHLADLCSLTGLDFQAGNQSGARILKELLSGRVSADFENQ